MLVGVWFEYHVPYGGGRVRLGLDLLHGGDCKGGGAEEAVSEGAEGREDWGGKTGAESGGGCESGGAGVVGGVYSR